MQTKYFKRKKFYTGVALDREVATYVDEIADRMGWTRSAVLNYIVGEHARRNGDDIILPALKKLIAEKEASR